MNPNHHAVVLYRVGNEYQQQNGEWVQLIGAENVGTHYETMYSVDASGQRVHRYTRRDYGRVTGSAHDYSDPRNLPPVVPLSYLLRREREIMEAAVELNPYTPDGDFDVRMFLLSCPARNLTLATVARRTGLEERRLEQLQNKRGEPASSLETCMLDLYYTGHVRD